MLNLDKHRFQLEWLKATIDEKHQELANWKSVVLHQDNSRSHISANPPEIDRVHLRTRDFKNTQAIYDHREAQKEKKRTKLTT